MKIPFTKYEIKLNKRSVYVQSGNQRIPLVEWLKGNTLSVPQTPVLENIYTSVANEFAKIDWKHVKYDKSGQMKEVAGDLNYLVSERPNPYQSKFDFCFTLMYQLFKYGNAFAYIKRDANGQAVEFMPIDCADYAMGSTLYEVDNSGWLYVKLKDKKGAITPVRYDNLLHLRLNPNNMFNGELGQIFDGQSPIVKLFDTSLAKLLEELNQSGTIYGVVTLGKSSGDGFLNTAIASEGSKRKKQEELRDRIKSTNGNILVLDAGEQWQSLSRPFETTDSETVNTFIQYLYEFNSINQKIVNGTATFQEMEVFFYRTVAPHVEQLESEYNYKVFSKSARSKGNRIEWYRNPFEYVPINTAIDVAYKGAMDITTNERRKMIYKLPPIEGGDILMENKNFQAVLEQSEGSSQNDDTETA